MISLGQRIKALRADQVEVREYEHTPLSRVQSWSDVPPGTPLFNTLVVFDYATLNTAMHAGSDQRGVARSKRARSSGRRVS